jgi:DNA polymerase III, delta subunit
MLERLAFPQERWRQALRLERPPQALIVVGAVAEQVRNLVQNMLQDFLCEQSPVGCGACGTCLRLQKQSHESLCWVRPENQNIKIEESRRILDFLSLRALKGRRAVVIESAQFLGIGSGPALLKTIEEPPEQVLFILTAEHRRQILPTLRSRSLVLSIESARQLPLENRDSMLELLDWWIDDPQAYTRTAWRERVKDRGLASEAAIYLQSFFREALSLWGHLQLPVLDPGLREKAQKLTRSGEQLFQAWSHSLQLEVELKKTRDAQLVFENFWIQTQSRAPGVV